VDKVNLALCTVGGGSLPHTDPDVACQLVLDTLDIPTWPQLPQRTYRENMYVQFSERFPGVVLAGERIYVDRNRDLDPQLEQLYLAYLNDDLAYGTINLEYAAGLHRFLHLDIGRPPAVKGQVTGPVSWGLTVVDQDRRPVLYDEVLADAVAKHLRLKAAWMERELRRLSPETIIFVDEPYMSSFGSAYISLEREQAIELITEVLAGIQGLKGVHCCGNTDWSLLMSTPINILHIDAYDYADSLALYPDEVRAFLGRGGMVGWGIIPASDHVWEETAGGLVDRFEAAVGLLTAKGLHHDDLLAAALISPSCGCGSLKVETAEQVLHMTAEVSKALKERYA
jgi:methionine synthase II (cobalamin-independent)